MSIVSNIIGYLIIVFAVLALMNGIKHYTKLSLVHTLAKYHYTFGAFAVVFALTHIVLNIVSSGISITGLIVAGLVVVTGSIGGTMKQTQNTSLLPVHKLSIAVTLIALLIHIFI